MRLTDEAKEFYDDALKVATEGPLSTGYGHPVNQEVRFAKVLDLLDRTNDNAPFSVLDVGCGTGDLLKFLECQEIKEYLGIDLHHAMVRTARQRFDREAEFRDIKFMELTAAGVWDTFDYSFAIGVYAHKEPDWSYRDGFEYVTEEIETIVSRTSRAALITLWSPWKTAVEPSELLINPTHIFDWAMQKYGRVEIDHSYAPHDFALTIYKDEGEWWKQHPSQKS